MARPDASARPPLAGRTTRRVHPQCRGHSILTVERTRDDLLADYGRYYGEQRFAITFTAALEGDEAKRVRGPWDKTGRLADGPYGEALVTGRGKTKNPAIVLRPSELIVLECDSEADLTRIQELGLPETLTVRSSKPYKRHYYFRPDPAMEMLPYVAFRFESGKLTADTGRYFLAPPAIHPSGAVYAFTPGHGPDDIAIATLPEALYRQLAAQSDTESKQQRSSLQIDPEAKIKEGNRRDYIFRYACMQRRWGLSEQEIVDACVLWSDARCEPPLTRDQIEMQVAGAMKKQGGQELAAAISTNGDTPSLERIKVVPLADFINVTEDIAPPLIGEPGDSLLPADGLLFMYGDGGAGKTTLSVDAMAHLASGTPWLDNPVTRPVPTILIENEGPRGPFRETLKKKVDNWDGGQFVTMTHILEEPWSRFTLRDENYRHELAVTIHTLGIDLVIVGPLASIGAKGAGTPDDVTDFALMISDLRTRAQRPFAIWIVHHENKQGDVSGAWERLPDTLVHVSAQGNGRTRVHWQKVRWSSRLHNTSINLLWADGGFTFEEARVRDLKAEILGAFRKDDRWRTAREVAGLIAANQDHVRDELHQLVIDEQMSFQIGPAGRAPNAKCWRLTSTDSEGLSHPESPDLPTRRDPLLTPLTPPTKESEEAEQEHPNSSTDSDSAESPRSPDPDELPF